MCSRDVEPSVALWALGIHVFAQIYLTDFIKLSLNYRVIVVLGLSLHYNSAPMKNSMMQNTLHSSADEMPAAVFYTWITALLLTVVMACHLLFSLEGLIQQLGDGSLRGLIFYSIVIASTLSLLWLMRSGQTSGRTVGPILVIGLLIAHMAVSSWLAAHKLLVVMPGAAIFWVAVHFIVGVVLSYQLAFGARERSFFERTPVPQNMQARLPAPQSTTVMLARYGCFILACWFMGQAIGMPATLEDAETVQMPMWVGVVLALELFVLAKFVQDAKPASLWLAAAAHLAAIVYLLWFMSAWWQALIMLAWLGMAIIFVLKAARIARTA